MPKNADISKIKIFPSAHLKASHITPVSYRKQGSDLFPRLQKELGRRIDEDTGRAVFTNFKVYCYEPKPKYPNFYIKIGMHNGANNGSVFCEVTVKEFDQLLMDLLKWRQDYNHEILDAIEQSKALKERKVMSESFSELVYNLERPDEFLKDLLEYKTSLSEIYTKQLSDREQIIQYYKTYKHARSPGLKKYYKSQIMALLPNHNQDFDELDKEPDNETENVVTRLLRSVDNEIELLKRTFTNTPLTCYNTEPEEESCELTHDDEERPVDEEVDTAEPVNSIIDCISPLSTESLPVTHPLDKRDDKQIKNRQNTTKKPKKQKKRPTTADN